MSIAKLFGPPGTGKTTSLINMVRCKINEGVAPHEIIFAAFTKRAALEARERACGQLKLEEDQIPWFRTIHSIAFQQLGLQKHQIMGLSDYIKFAESLGLRITYKNYAEDGTFAGQTEGDRLLFMESLSRAKNITLREQWESQPNEDIYFYKLEHLAKSLEEYKRANEKMDFTDILGKFDLSHVPDCRVLIVDEAQDLSPAQWRIVHCMMEKIPEVFIAGDDDQAIFRWAGADVDHFINLEGTSEVLGKSFRVPSEIQKVADVITSRMQVRVPKQWDPRVIGGEVMHYSSVEQVDMRTGDWLLLARNAYLLDEYVHHCLREGFLFTAPGQDNRDDILQAIHDWEALRAGGQVPAAGVKKIYSLMSIRVGVTYGFKGKVDALPDRKLLTMKELRSDWGLLTEKEWSVALDKMTVMDREYLLAALRNGETFNGRPRIRISTIHGAKGAEASNVVVMTDMAIRTYNEMNDHPDDEHRCWYVAVTRAKEKLHIIQPKTNLRYDI